ncbi:MAG: diaminopimelate decarboxylase [Candidatus Gracilibacteria bacterium]|jgi:diaminopimelate decarboxylase|nr:diaminopimelate decarboxylase [Candidatus Gracilibacteria bacterium]
MHKNLEELAHEHKTPLYVYDEDRIRQNYRNLKDNFTYPKTRFFYAVKSNYNPHILRILLEEGSGVDTVSVNEVKLALEADFSPDQIIFTPANLSDEDIDFAVEQGVILNLGSISEINRLGERYPGYRVSVRINPNVGAGHHEHTITGGESSKFGVSYLEAGKIKEAVDAHRLDLVGIHSHIGSGILDTETFLYAMDVVLDVASNFDTLGFVDFGGGFGVPYKGEDQAMDLGELGRLASEKFAKFAENRNIEMYFEPGRYIVCDAGIMLTKVNTIKTNPQGRKFACVDSGYAQLVRPMIYGSYHEIINVSNPDGAKEQVDIAGNICESGDMFARQREISAVREGDVLAVLSAGAYGASMASNYNLQAIPAEILVNNQGQIKKIRNRQVFSDILKMFDF